MKEKDKKIFFSAQVEENLTSDVEIKIGLASPEKILSWSRGEVKKAETVNYRTYKPEKEGLFCEKIFGPVKDWECHCGKYKRVKYKNVICDRCGVEVTLSKVRRERMGHIKLCTPVAHIWYVKGVPYPMAKLLDLKQKKLESIIYFENYIVIEINEEARKRTLDALEKKEEKEINKIMEESIVLKEKLEQKVVIYEKINKNINENDFVTTKLLKELQNLNIKKIKVEIEVADIEKDGVAAMDIFDNETNEKLIKEGESLSKDNLAKLKEKGIIKVCIYKNVDEYLNEIENEKNTIDATVEKKIKNIKKEIMEVKSKITELKKNDLLDEENYQLLNEYIFSCGEFCTIKIGAEAIKLMLQKLNLEKISKELNSKLKTTKSVQERKEIVDRLRVIESFRRSGNKPEWMILDVLPIIPPDLRPLVYLDSGKFASSDLNDLYRRVINRNNRLQKLFEIKAPEIILRNEKRMLQEAVDILFDNGRRGKVATGTANRPLKSLSEVIRGKQGRFRQNLLGKRVDYSGRSVIVVSPELKLHQCGLPKKMAMELYKPFVLRKLEENGFIHIANAAKKIGEDSSSEVWNILEEVIKHHPVLLNRAPTLHRLGIQAFEPVLIEGKAIAIHPLVCAGFNADFDGDTMAVHLPLSSEALKEAEDLMLATNNILSPANGKPLVIPSQDMVLGCAYLTKMKNTQIEPRIFSNMDEVLIAYNHKKIDLYNRIKVRIDNKIIETTVGRVIFNKILPPEIPFLNKELDKKEISNLISTIFRKLGQQKTVELLDKIKELGFIYATFSGATVGLNDMCVPHEKDTILKEAWKKREETIKKYKKGVITDGERYNTIINIFTHATDEVSNAMFKVLEKDKDGFNPIFMMADSGSRGSKLQVRQLAGMRGLMAKPSGEIIEVPITANFREGLSILEYFISTHGARKGLADTALKTADAGYLTRRLVDVAQDIIVSEEDCGTINGKTVKMEEGEKAFQIFRSKILGRVVLEDIIDPITSKVIIKAKDEITEEIVSEIEEKGIEKIRVRSVLNCEAKRGVCRLCYGRDLSTGKLVNIGEAVGIIAAQSIGEPGTQLTMRTFHIGGTASRTVEQSKIEAKSDGTVRFYNLKTVKKKDGTLIVLKRNGVLNILDEQEREKETHQVPIGAILHIEEGAIVKKGDLLVTWDLYTIPILTENNGKVVFKDIIEGITMKEEIDEESTSVRVIIEHRGEIREETYRPQILIIDKNDKVVNVYDIPKDAHLSVYNNEEVSAGDVLAKLHGEISKTKDITGGLPRVVELFEARKSKNFATISEIDGIVNFAETSRGERTVIITNETGEKKEYNISYGKHMNVHSGDKIKAGESLVDGPLDPHDILRVLGDNEVQEFLVNEIQEVYGLQGVEINDKHIEIIVKQMLRKVKIENPGDTNFLVGEQIDKLEFREENEKVIAKGEKPALAKSVLIGITKASLATDSFIAAASFQETTKVLVDAAISGKCDKMLGLKENVIMGRLIPSGTGWEKYKKNIKNK